MAVAQPPANFVDVASEQQLISRCPVRHFALFSALGTWCPTQPGARFSEAVVRVRRNCALVFRFQNRVDRPMDPGGESCEVFLVSPHNQQHCEFVLGKFVVIAIHRI